MVMALNTTPTTITAAMNVASLMAWDVNRTISMTSSAVCNAVINSRAFFLFIVFFSFLLTFLRQTLGFAQGLGDDPLQLAVGAAELVRSPGLYRVHRIRVDTEDETLCLLLSHELMVQRSCVHDWLSGIVTTEHDEQVRDHRSLLVIVEVYDIFIGEFVECHLHH